MRFRPEQHLRRQNDIRAVRERGFRTDCTSFVLWARRRDDGAALAHPRAGVVASSASVGGAVARNRAKRRLRELFRRHQSRVPTEYDLLLVARTPVRRASYPELERAFAAACARLASHA
ncbi:MAG: ribonuclease P protein component [Opitutaceae bacterium]